LFPPLGPDESFPDPLLDRSSSPLDVVARPSPADAVTFAGSPPEVDVPLLSDPDPEPDTIVRRKWD